MKELIIQALNDAMIVLEKTIPQTTFKTKYVNIDDVKPSNITSFMKENNIPDNAYFGGTENGYDSFDSVCLCYDVNIPTTDEEKLKFKRTTFTTIAFKNIFDLLIKNNYKRIGFNSGVLKQFNDTTVYDMYINKDFDRLVKYYSLAFSKNI